MKAVMAPKMDPSAKGGRMRPRYKILIFTLWLYAVGSTVFNGTPISLNAYDTGVAHSQYRFTIASYHPGPADLRDPDTIRAMADILSRFEIVALQCVRDENADAALYEIVEEMNHYGYRYDYLLSPDAEEALTRYAFVYRADSVYPVQWYSYDDSKEHDFTWDPFVARFEIDADTFDVTLVNYHAEPESRPREIDLLPHVIDDVKERFPDETDIIVLCSAKTGDNSLIAGDPFAALEQMEYILLLDAAKNHLKGADNPVEPQIIIAATSGDMYWEDAGLFSIDAQSSEGQDTGAVLSASRLGYSSITIVNDEPGDREDKKQGSSSKAFCFFGTTSN